MEEIILRSGESQLGVERQTGRVSRLEFGHARYVASPGRRGPLRFHQPLEDFQAHIVESHQTVPSVIKNRDGIVLDCADLLGARGPTGVSAQVEIRPAPGGAFEMSCTIRNGGKACLPQVFFPWISGVAPVDGPDDVVMFGKSSLKPWQEWKPCNDWQKVIFGRHLGFPQKEVRCYSPYTAGMKWMDFGGRSAGVALYSTCRDPEAMFMLVSADSWRELERINLAYYSYPYIEPGQTWRSAVFVIYPHAGDWHAGAMRFKEFADRAFNPVPSTPERDETIGQFTLWITWPYQDFRKLRYTYRDVPAIAAEARAAGLREMTIERGSELDFTLNYAAARLPPLGSDAELKEAVAKCRQLGVNLIAFVSCHLIREHTIPPDADPEEWFLENLARHRFSDDWTYDPGMTPFMPIQQICRAAYFICPGSKQWRKAYFEMIDYLYRQWGFTGLMFDMAMACKPLCFNPRHAHKPDAIVKNIDEVLRETRRLLAERHGAVAAFSGEGQWDCATEWMDFTWDWIRLANDEHIAPFHMAFPRARNCLKCGADISLVNRIFTAGYWVDMYLEEGGARLGDYPELTAYLASLAAFKKHFSPFFNRRDAYLHTMCVEAAPADGVWHRGHRSGHEALIMVAGDSGQALATELTIDVAGMLGRDGARLTVWTRRLEKISTCNVSREDRVALQVPANDFVAVHMQ